MVAIVRTYWDGTSGGPGLTQFALEGAAGGEWNPGGTNGAVSAVRVFWDSLKALLPDELRLTVSPIIDDYNSITGKLVGSYVASTTPTVVAGTSATSYAAGAGAKITWNTNQISNGRRVRGSTFLVPLAAANYTITGTISAAAIATINNSAGNLISGLATASTPLAVWSRPIKEPNARAGFDTQVVSGTCGSKTAILRGRRD